MSGSSPSPSPSSPSSSPRATTPPKGRATRSRAASGRRPVFGSTARWIAAFVALAVALLVLWLATEGGDLTGAALRI